ncbi:UNVERIFIED_CONTAM: Glucan endo-1,3-beta-glucosidase 4 [Sesamum calycinum]|uniref:glucan endo-1,3-beta-D-glucosidase n=1 Tax=Sesamum calycinum TaxID=2727403 RepID=A0AAW2NTM5_9LAMI
MLASILSTKVLFRKPGVKRCNIDSLSWPPDPYYTSGLGVLDLVTLLLYVRPWIVIFAIGIGADCRIGSFVGINIGTDISNLPSAVEIVAILRAHSITHVRLFDADARMLNALSNTGIEVMVSVTNEEVTTIGESPSAAADWINKNVAAYVPTTNITAIAVGSEVLTSLPNASAVIVPAMNYLNKALVASNLNYLVKVSTPHSMGIISRPFPPSTATFNATWNSTIYQILQFLKNTNSFYMLNAYPYYEYVKSNGIFPLEYALFKPLPSVKQIVDPNTLFHYSSMFDALVDAAYNSIAALNFSGIPIVVTETGWPWSAGANEPDATAENAETYNKNLIRRVANDTGPPSQPAIPINTYIYELFNEDKRVGPESGRNWGVLFTNGTAVYDIKLSTSESLDANSSVVFCIARPGADETSLQDGLNWACGPGQANCGPIQQGQPCYMPNTLQNHASYAYNDYYQKMRSSGGTCDFRGTGTTTTVDPILEIHCNMPYNLYQYLFFLFVPKPRLWIMQIYRKSEFEHRGGLFPPPAFGPIGPSSGSPQNLVHLGTVFALFAALILSGPCGTHCSIMVN